LLLLSVTRGNPVQFPRTLQAAVRDLRVPRRIRRLELSLLQELRLARVPPLEARLQSPRRDPSLTEARRLHLARVLLERAQLVRRVPRLANLQNPSHLAKRRVSKI
jgi:hypothetical protein